MRRHVPADNEYFAHSRGILQNYKYQPRLEKRNEQIKSVYAVMPMLFKRIDRIDAFLFIFFVAMLIEALIERSVRLSMKSRKIKSIPIYYERKEVRIPDRRTPPLHLQQHTVPQAVQPWKNHGYIPAGTQRN
ncbi:hypothetical protein B1B_17914, partial [mine drainage metagenome]